MEFRSKDKLTQKAIENFITVVGYASRNVGIEIEVKRIKEEKPFEFSGRVSEAP
jgi:hypothetical protein